VLQVIFETLNTDESGEDDEEEPPHSRQNRLRDEVLALFGERTVVTRLQELAGVLWNPPDAGWCEWARRRYLATLGGALVEACAQLCPEAAVDDLLVDIDPGARPAGVPQPPLRQGEIWITEATVGGGGILEEVARRYAEDPRHFFRLVENALGPSEYELVDSELTRILEMAEQDDAFAALLQDVRSASRHADLEAGIARIELTLAARGVLVTHAIVSALHARILRPGSSRATDALLLALTRRWRMEEGRLGIEIDARVFAYLASEDAALTQALPHVDATMVADRAFRFHALYGLLWPRGSAVRSVPLSTYNPFAPLPPAARELVLDRLTRTSPTIAVGANGWRAAVADALRESGIARLTTPLTEREALKTGLLELAAEPLEIDALHLYPRVEGIARGPDGFFATLHLPEAVQ